MKRLNLFFVLLLSCWCMTGCTITNRYGPYHGKVVARETKEPIEGAAVLVVFYTVSATLGGAVYHYADAIETVTDKNGEFKLAAHRIISPGVLRRWDDDENVTIFKPGYGCYPSHPDVQALGLGFQANKFVTIELPKLRTKDERLANESCFPASVPNNKMEKLIELNNIERRDLGLEPTHIKD